MKHHFAPLLLILAAGACAPSPTTLTASHASAMQDSVRAALAIYQRYAANAQWDSLVGLYRFDATFRWIESGVRSNGAAVKGALTGMPGLKVETKYDSVEVVALAPGLASLTTKYHSVFVGSSPLVQFGGAISMLWSHEPEGWRIRGGHSSSPAPHGGSE